MKQCKEVAWLLLMLLLLLLLLSPTLLLYYYYMHYYSWSINPKVWRWTCPQSSFTTNGLRQGAQARASLPCVFINKVGLNAAMPVHFHMVCDCFPAIRTELSSRNRDLLGLKAKNIYYLTFYRKGLPAPGLSWSQWVAFTLKRHRKKVNYSTKDVQRYRGEKAGSREKAFPFCR